MKSITQNYNKILEEIIINNLDNILKDKLHRYREDNQVMNYIDIISSLDDTLCNVAKETLITVFESLDKGYRNSNLRKHSYYVKANTQRTLLTIFGQITYRKTIYENKYTGKTYCYIDDYLGLKKHDYFDPYIKATIIEYAANNSSVKIIKFINDLIGNRLKIKPTFNYISRQTIRNIILDAKLANQVNDPIETPENLYIMADEKWVHTQNNKNQKVMVKAIVLFDGRNKTNNKCKLLNKRTFCSFNNNNFINDCLDYIYYTYDTNLIKNIYIMGDGAKWIKSLLYELNFDNNINVSFSLDKFHFKQAIHHIFQNKELEEIVTAYVISNKKNDFKLACDKYIESFPHRKETIEMKKEYILNNWKSINNLYINNLKCPMESQISHVLADLLTSRPKGYSLKTLSKILPLRIKYKNNENIKLLYLMNYNKKEIVEMNQQFLNTTIFNKKYYEFDLSNINPKYLINHKYDNTTYIRELYTNF